MSSSSSSQWCRTWVRLFSAGTLTRTQSTRTRTRPGTGTPRTRTPTRCTVDTRYCHILPQALHNTTTRELRMMLCLLCEHPALFSRRNQKHLILSKTTAYGGKAHLCQAPVHDELQHLYAPIDTIDDLITKRTIIVHHKTFTADC